MIIMRKQDMCTNHHRDCMVAILLLLPTTQTIRVPIQRSMVEDTACIWTIIQQALYHQEQKGAAVFDSPS